jgi:hypothetical protein
LVRSRRIYIARSASNANAPSPPKTIPIEEGNGYGKEAAELYGVTALPAICKKDWTKDWLYNDECRMAVLLCHILNCAKW